MKQLVLPLVLALAGAGGGFGAGLLLRPPPATPEDPTAGAGHSTDDRATANLASAAPPGRAAPSGSISHGSAGQDGARSDFVKLNNQFVVPVLRDGKVVAMVVLSLTIETPLGAREEVYAIEPRIRDAFLQVMFDYANSGGFDGTFTQAQNLDDLRVALRKSARTLLGAAALDILVTDIARQDI